MADNTDNEKRPMFGARYLEDPKDAFKHNVWDNIQWDAELEEDARKKVEMQAGDKIPEDKIECLKKDTDKSWDKFYGCHQDRFFKDRHWLFTEFPELAGEQQKADTPVRVYPSGETSSLSQDTLVTHSELPGAKSAVTESQASQDEPERKSYLEIGCGVGNTVFPILEYNTDPNLFVYCCDFSTKAIDILTSQSDYDPKRCDAFVCDVTADEWMTPFPSASLDIVTLIFTLSAVPPQRMKHVVSRVYHYLKPGGRVLFRDYGRYDMAQLRFKGGQMMEDNFYVRKDGTFVYFFTQEEVRDLFCGVGFEEELNHVDRRLQVNRSRLLKMYRVWVQAKFRKPLS